MITLKKIDLGHNIKVWDRWVFHILLYIDTLVLSLKPYKNRYANTLFLCVPYSVYTYVH